MFWINVVYTVLAVGVSYSVLITLDNKFQFFFCIFDEYVINLFVCIYEVRKGTQLKLLGSSFKMMLPLWYITK